MYVSYVDSAWAKIRKFPPEVTDWTTELELVKVGFPLDPQSYDYFSMYQVPTGPTINQSIIPKSVLFIALIEPTVDLPYHSHLLVISSSRGEYH